MSSEVIVAARNNAEWCDIVCRTHGVIGRFHRHFWASPRRTPPLYPDAVTLDAEAKGEQILRNVDTETPGCSVKDSFATLDLSFAGFEVLFEGEWIRRAPERTRPSPGSGIRWRRVHDADVLLAWEASWSGNLAAMQLFKPALLNRPSVMMLGGYLRGRIVAGAILNRSPAAIGVSNLFTTQGDHGDAWAGCLAAVAEAFPMLPIIGYETGDAIDAAHKYGFRAIGHLRVWIKEDGNAAPVSVAGQSRL